MRVAPLPKLWLIHTVIYEEYLGKSGDWNEVQYAPPIAIESVRFDDSTVFSRDANQTKIVANGIVFVDTTNSGFIPAEFKEESRITFEGRTYMLKKVVPCYYPKKKEVRHYELEVV